MTGLKTQFSTEIAKNDYFLAAAILVLIGKLITTW